MNTPPVLELRGITKAFPGVLANDHINLDLRPGEIHTILGENGAGKSTLMSIIAGLYAPDEGEIRMSGEPRLFRNPRQAIEHGIGMVFQHFMLVRNHTVAENIILGQPGAQHLDFHQINREIREISERYDLQVDPSRRVRDLSVGEQQRVEIVKVLFRGARVLILDEPTAVLTPQESEALYRIMQRMSREGQSILFISHKMKEVMALSHRITIIHHGRVMATLNREETTPEALAALMMGHQPKQQLDEDEVVVLQEARAERVAHETEEHAGGAVIVRLQDVHAVNDLGHPALKGVSLELCEGEVLGMAGVSGNGQSELAEIISGLRGLTSGEFQFDRTPILRADVNTMIQQGVGYIPEDRKKFGVASGMDIARNFLLRDLQNQEFFQGPLLQNRYIQRYGLEKMKAFDVRAPSERTPVGLLSGGNMQKVILARETSRPLRVLLACQPTRGLDIHATRFIREEIQKGRDRGLAVLWVSEDLDELMLVSDRIAVIFDGRVVGTVHRAEASVPQIGRMMTGMESSSP